MRTRRGRRTAQVRVAAHSFLVYSDARAWCGLSCALQTNRMLRTWSASLILCVLYVFLTGGMLCLVRAVRALFVLEIELRVFELCARAL